MSARSRKVAGSRERGRPRAVPEVLCENPLPTTPCTIALAHSFLASKSRSRCLCRGKCLSYRARQVLLSVPRSVCVCVFNLSHVFLCLTAFSARQSSMQTSVFASSPLHGDPLISQDTLGFHSDSSSRKTHKFVGRSLVHKASTFAAPHRRAAARLPWYLSRHTHPRVSAATVHVRSCFVE